VTETSGEISAVTLSGASWTLFQYDLPANTSRIQNQMQINKENGSIYYNQLLDLILHKISATDRTELKNLVKNRLIIFGEDLNSNIIMLGIKQGMEVAGGNLLDTGQAKGDLSGHTLQFMGEEPEPAALVSITGSTLESTVEALAMNITVTVPS